MPAPSSEPPHGAVCWAAVNEADPAARTVDDPLARRTWADPDGVVWRRRGDGPLPPRQGRRLLGRPDVLLAHVYDGPLHLHDSAEERVSLVEELERYWRGEDPDPMHDFTVWDLRDATGRAMAVVRERC